MVGRAGVGVDNVDVAAASKRGIIVANAPQSNVDHRRRAHDRAAAGARAQRAAGPGLADRRRLGALQVQRRRAVREDARRARLRPHRPARGPARARLRHARGRLRRLRRRGALPRARASSAPTAPTSSTPQADFITIHLPVTDETRDWLDAEAFAKMKDGVRVDQRRARRAARRRRPQGRARLGQGRRRRARRVPRGAGHRAPAVRAIQTSSSRRTSAPRPPRHRPRRLPGCRAGAGGAHRRRRHHRGQRAGRCRRGPRGARPVPPARAHLGRIAAALAAGTSVDALEVEYRGRIAERDTRLLTVQVLKGALGGTHRGGRQRRQRPGARRRARDRGLGDQAPRRRATSPTWCA